MTQLLYSDTIVGFLNDFARETEHRPDSEPDEKRKLMLDLYKW